MKPVTCLALGLALQAGRSLAAETPDLQLTGLADVGSLRTAWFKVAANHDSFSIHPGETGGGYTLKELHAREGWVLMALGSKEFRLRLTEPALLAPKPAPAAAPAAATISKPAVLAADLHEGPASSEENHVLAVEANGVQGQVPIAQDGPVAGWVGLRGNRTSDNAGRNVQAPVTAPADTLVPSQNSTPAGPTAPSNSSATDTFPSAPAPSEPSVGAASPAPFSSSDDVLSKDPLQAERQQGDQIRGMYGLEAFFAWDLKHRPSSGFR